MKTLLITIISIFFSSFVFSLEKNKVNVFEIKCIVKSLSSKISTATVRITEKGKQYQNYLIEKGKVKFNLPKNSKFMLEISSNGHLTKRVAISTEIANKAKSIPSLILTMTLIEEGSCFIMDSDKDLLDILVVFMAYDAKAGVFYDKNKYYTEIIMKGLNKSAKEYMKTNRVAYK